MTKFLTKAALAATVALFATPAFAAPSSANVDFTAKAKIIKAVTIVKNSDLDFGTITMLSTLTAQTVTVGQTNTKNCGGAALTCSFPAQAAATFTVTGVPNQALDISLTGPAVLTNATSDTVAFRPSAPASITVAAGGTVSFGIGGDIDVISATKDGDYSAIVNVTATYQ